MRKSRIHWLLTGVLALAPALVQASVNTAQPRPLEQRVRHELLMLPYYNVFDNLAFQVQGNRVILSGQVTQPVLKSDAEHVVASIPGVEGVTNRIEVLPLSGFDNQIRWAELRAIYGFPSLQRYGAPVNPSIHIIVRGGHVTLEGVVDNEADRNLAYIRANGVPGVFSVENNLRVATL